MRRLFSRIIARLPLQFRVLYRQFLLRVIDLEALSIEADIPRFLGQVAGVLIMFSLIHALGTLWFPTPLGNLWRIEQARISDMMLVIGLGAVLTWDTVFPDRRDVFVLAPLPIRPAMLLLAKISASTGLMVGAVIALNFASSFSCSLVYGMALDGPAGMIRFYLSYWFAIFSAAGFLFGSVLTVQGLGALLLPRRMFLRLSAILQLLAFATFLGAYFLQPTLNSFAEVAVSSHDTLVSCSPTFWFVALFNQLNGTLPDGLFWLAHRAWIALAIVTLGAASSLWLCYVRTMKKTVEEPDLVPGSGGRMRMPQFGRSLHTAILLFSLRSIVRSRQHRVVLAFFWSVVIAIALGWAHQALSASPAPINVGFFASTFIMMTVGVVGLRGVFSLPISLKANWMLRVTQLRPTKTYIAATRRALLFFGTLPILLISAMLGLQFRPLGPVAQHLIFLTLLGLLLTECAMIHFDKIPFTCSYLPGKANVQVVFWGFVFVVVMLSFLLALAEQDALRKPLEFVAMMGVAGLATVGLSVMNRVQAKSAVLYFEEEEPEVLIGLGLGGMVPTGPLVPGVEP